MPPKKRQSSDQKLSTADQKLTPNNEEADKVVSMSAQPHAAATADLDSLRKRIRTITAKFVEEFYLDSNEINDVLIQYKQLPSTDRRPSQQVLLEGLLHLSRGNRSEALIALLVSSVGDVDFTGVSIVDGMGLSIVGGVGIANILFESGELARAPKEARKAICSLIMEVYSRCPNDNIKAHSRCFRILQEFKALNNDVDFSDKPILLAGNLVGMLMTLMASVQQLDDEKKRAIQLEIAFIRKMLGDRFLSLDDKLKFAFLCPSLVRQIKNRYPNCNELDLLGNIFLYPRCGVFSKSVPDVDVLVFNPNLWFRYGSLARPSSNLLERQISYRRNLIAVLEYLAQSSGEFFAKSGNLSLLLGLEENKLSSLLHEQVVLEYMPQMRAELDRKLAKSSPEEQHALLNPSLFALLDSIRAKRDPDETSTDTIATPRAPLPPPSHVPSSSVLFQPSGSKREHESEFASHTMGDSSASAVRRVRVEVTVDVSNVPGNERQTSSYYKLSS